jgi:hypothetical protein
MQSAHLQTLLDEREILQLVNRYCRALDTKDWLLLDDVFVVDATADLAGPSPLVGIEAIRARIRVALEHLDVSQHLVGTHEVSVDGDLASHRCYLQAQHVRREASGGINYIVGGRYEDRLARTDVGWRIVHRTLVVMWTEGNIAVVRVD